jgi:nitrogen regulatory protein PII
MNFKLIVSMVKATVTEKIVEAAKSAGGTGATIIPARGTGIHEAKTFFGLTLETHTDLVLFLVEEAVVEPVLDAISEKGKFKEPGTGIAFVVDVQHAVGLESQIEHFKREAKKET